LREDISARLNGQGDKRAAFDQVVQDIDCRPDGGAGRDYLAAGQTRHWERFRRRKPSSSRFFDESGGIQL
jgi:hypothetical protein